MGYIDWLSMKWKRLGWASHENPNCTHKDWAAEPGGAVNPETRGMRGALQLKPSTRRRRRLRVGRARLLAAPTGWGSSIRVMRSTYFGKMSRL